MTRTLDIDRLLGHSEWLAHIAFDLVHDHELAQDVVQQTWLAALTRPPGDVASDAGLRAWLARVAHNVVRMHARAESRRRRRERDAARGEAVADAVDRVAVQRNIADAVLTLDAADREVVVLRYFENLPPRRIAKRLATTSSAVRSRLTRALAKLRARLDAAYGGDDRRWATALLGIVPTRVTAFAVLTNGPVLASLAGAALLIVAAWSGWHFAVASAQDEPAVASAQQPEAGLRSHSDREGDENVDRGAERDPVASAETNGANAPPVEARQKMVVLARCVDSSQSPVEGVDVVAVAIKGQPRARTDRDGRARLEFDWPPELLWGNNHFVFVEVQGRGWASSTRQESVEGACTVQLGDLQLLPGGTVSGRILNADGSPAAGVSLSIACGASPGAAEIEEMRRVLGTGFRYGVSSPSNKETDANGKYRVEGVEARSISVVARSRGHYCAFTPPFSVEHGGEVTAPDLILEPVTDANRIKGVVLDSEGQPVPRARIEVWENRGPRNVNPVTQAFVGDDGAFAAVVPARSPFTLEVVDRRGKRKLLRHDVTAGMHDLELRFPVERSMNIDVRGVKGDLLDEIEVSVLDEQTLWLDARIEDQADGTKTLTVPSIPFHVTVSKRGFLTHWAGPFEPGRAPNNLEVRLQPAGAIRGRVVANGRPVAGAKIHLHVPAHGKRMGVFAAKLYTRLEGYVRGRPVETDVDGCFTYFLTHGSTYYVHAEAAGWARGESGPFELATGASVNDIEIRLERPATLEGRLLLAPGVEVAGSLVAITGGDGHVRTAFVEADGEYRFEGLAPGGWQIARAEPDQYEWLRTNRTWTYDPVFELPSSVTLEPGETKRHDLDLRHIRPKRITGRLRLDRVPASGWQVWAAKTKGRTDADGRFDLVAPLGGDVEVWLQRDLPRNSRLSAVVVVSDQQEIDIDERTARVELHDLDWPDETALHSGLVPNYALVLGADEEVRWQLEFDPDSAGQFSVDGVPVGKYELRSRDGQREWRCTNWRFVRSVEVR